MINPRLRVRADAKFAGASAYKGDPFISGTTGPNAPVLLPKAHSMFLVGSLVKPYQGSKFATKKKFESK